MLFNNTFLLRLGPVLESLGVRDLRGLWLVIAELIYKILYTVPLGKNLIILRLKIVFKYLKTYICFFFENYSYKMII